MKHIVAICLAGSFVVAGTPTAGAAPVASHHHRPMVLATWFSNNRPMVGQKEAVYVQLFRDDHRFGGAPMTATIQGAATKLHLRGTRTNKQGIAYANFTIPLHTAGHWLRAFTSVKYRGTTYIGTNRVKVNK